MSDPATSSSMRARTRWTREAAAPLRTFLRTEAASSAVLLLAIVAALVWANVDTSSYESVWHTRLSIRIGSFGVTRDLRTWINSGLMSLFFLVVGLEARREVDLGELRERRRIVLPLTAGVAGMMLPVAIYLAITAGDPGWRGWGTAMSTDTALALGLLALVGRVVPDEMRAFLLTVFVVDDLVALAVIVFGYTTRVEAWPLVVALVVFGVLIAAHVGGLDRGVVFGALGVVMWCALLASGVDPVVTGLAVGLLAPAYTPSRAALESATGLFRRFREQPTPELAASASAGLAATLSLNARLQRRYLPWTTYAIVPLFGLANAGFAISGDFLAHAYTTPITLGVFVGYAVGKPIAVAGTSGLIARLTAGRVRPSVGWAALTGSGTIAGIGFTVSLLIASLTFHGRQLAEAKLGILTAGVVAALLTWGVLRVASSLPPARKARALLGDAERITDLVVPVDPDRDHIRGPQDALVTVVEYGDYQCPYCGRAESAVREILKLDDVRYVWRHLPLTDVHPQAWLGAEAAEAAAAQGSFWPMHDTLLARQELRLDNLLRYAEDEGLDLQRFRDDLKRHVHAARVAQDTESADLSGVSGTPTFFINGQRHYGAYDAQTLTAAIKIARARALINPARSQPTAKPG